MSEFPERVWLWRDQYHYPNVSTSKIADRVIGLKSTEFVRADLHDTVTAERDAAKAVIKELVSAVQGLANSRPYEAETLRRLLAWAKELLK